MHGRVVAVAGIISKGEHHGGRCEEEDTDAWYMPRKGPVSIERVCSLDSVVLIVVSDPSLHTTYSSLESGGYQQQVVNDYSDDEEETDIAQEGVEPETWKWWQFLVSGIVVGVRDVSATRITPALLKWFTTDAQ